MERRAIFPVIMFALAGASFLLAGWQYLQARAIQASAQERMAYIITTIEESSVGYAQKQGLYASIMGGLPPAPGLFGLDVSGSFASPAGGDLCTGEGQRSVCLALKREAVSAAVRSSVCGQCNPQ